ncbi:hypothetical protein ACFWWM_36510 [Streptomyces sp. NPDC058682]|uniref:hypothetical protein n=1 Tax=unclassified Streptomyces TaxID=2593676 RepID=UPI002257420D|nr:hypothetical protein [Streptomyces sp. NBC_01214]MCX4807129.1 hypothetical protein [Streptomyces sp. NBC_01214]
MLNSTDSKAIQTTRAWAGLLVVLFGDVGIALAAILVALHLKEGPEAAVAILTSAFTAITAMTSAYFGIRAAANTAQSAVAGIQSGGGQGTQGKQLGGQ